MLSWQFALTDGSDLVEFVFLKDGKLDLSLTDALGVVLDKIGRYVPVDVRKVRRYTYCPEWCDGKPVEVVTDNFREARNRCRYVYRSGIGFSGELIDDMPDRYVSRAKRDWAWFHRFLDFSDVDSVRVCLVCHAGKVDLSALSYEEKNLLRHLTECRAA